jgi:WD40 repeat protein
MLSRPADQTWFFLDRANPFIAANSVVAVGDEEGYIRLLDSNNEFDKVHLSFQAHSNAVIDIAFSDDDYLLATASGDQTGKVFDMLTQTSVASLRHHTASLKQIRFQPGRGNNSVLATSSRDGSVQIWDLRCSGGAPIQEILDRPHSLGYRAPRHIKSGCVVNSIYGAHARAPQHRYQTRQNVNPLPSAATTSTDVGHRGEVPGRAGEVSVTAIQFLPPGREHLLLSASEADATVKLWDIRSVQTGSKSHKHYATPVSYTRQPDSHLSFRPFGISGLALSGDGGRLYALCKDNTVYAYSTPHLILGHAPELSKTAGSEPPRRLKQAGQGGLGPMYGFRHPSFHATSFYIKAAVRPARDGRPEMLAVGSSDGCPVVFPTDERYFRRDLSAGRGAPPNGVDERAAAAGVVMNPAASSFSSDGGMVPRGRPRPGGLTRTNSITNLSARLADTIPIFKPYGTALVRGHDKEVGPLAWTRDGKLVTVGDDYAIRCWGEDREKAADLRRGGEVNGRRWACGWADVGEGWEGDEDDW